MNKKLLALLAVAAVGVSVAGATPQTQFNKGEFQVDLGAAHSKAKTEHFNADAKWNFDGGLTYALSDKTAIQYGSILEQKLRCIWWLCSYFWR